MNVMVTGGTGYLGAEVVRTLLTTSSHRVVVLARNAERAARLTEWCHPWATRLQILPGDICTLSELPMPVDVIVHAAALRPVPGHQAELVRVNVAGTLNLLQLAATHGVQRFLLVSSQSVYGDQPAPWREDTVPAPDGAYAITKFAAEQLLWAFAHTMTVAAVRPSRMYGVSLFVRWDELLGKFVRLACQGSPLPLSGDGLQRMDFVHIRDVGEAILLLLQADANRWHQVYNLGGGASLTIRSIADLVSRIAHDMGLPSVSTQCHPAPLPPGPQHLELDIARARDRLGWVPRQAFCDGLAEYFQACHS